MLSMFALPDFAAMHRYFSDREIADLFVCYVREQRGQTMHFCHRCRLGCFDKLPPLIKFVPSSNGDDLRWIIYAYNTKATSRTFCCRADLCVLSAHAAIKASLLSAGTCQR